jgi:aminopeptidase N
VPPSSAGQTSFVVTKHVGVPVMWTLSEPYGSRDWWPCKNGLNDKADSVDVQVTVPEAYQTSSNGVPVAEVVQGGFRTTWWKHRYPIASYLVAISATNFVVQADTVALGTKVLPLMQRVWAERTGTFLMGFPYMKIGLRGFTKYFGDYPFDREQYGHTQFGRGGGMEHQSNSFMGTINQSLVYHEMAHQWFGDRITCGSWQHIWLNEGFATFSMYLLYEDLLPHDENLGYRKDLNRNITSKPDGSVFVSDTTSESRIFSSRLSYNKGAMLLRMLRGKLGDSAFFRGVRAYLGDPALAYRYAVTDDLKHHLEQASGKDLTEFFKDWFYGEGYPSYQMHWKPVGTEWVSVSLGQTTSHPSVDFYEMPVPVKFIKGTIEKTVIIDHLRNPQTAYLNLGFTPDSAVIDPEIWLLSWNNTVVRDPDDGPGEPLLTIYPNPVVDQLHLLLRRMPTGRTSIRLYNAVGQLLWKQERDLIRSNDYLLIPMEGLPHGVYAVSVSQGGRTPWVKKLVK